MRKKARGEAESSGAFGGGMIALFKAEPENKVKLPEVPKLSLSWGIPAEMGS
jgi:hypothetical protein